MNWGDSGHHTGDITWKREILPKSHVEAEGLRGKHRSSRSLFSESGTGELCVASLETYSEGVVERSLSFSLKIAPRFFFKARYREWGPFPLYLGIVVNNTHPGFSFFSSTREMPTKNNRGKATGAGMRSHHKHRFPCGFSTTLQTNVKDLLHVNIKHGFTTVLIWIKLTHFTFILA